MYKPQCISIKAFNNTSLRNERYNVIINITMSYIQIDDVYSSKN